MFVFSGGVKVTISHTVKETFPLNKPPKKKFKSLTFPSLAVPRFEIIKIKSKTKQRERERERDQRSQRWKAKKKL